MNICIQNTIVAKGERDFNNTVLSLRLTPMEAERFWKVMDAVKSRNPYIGKSDIYRELMGLKELIAITETELLFFRTGSEEERYDAMPFSEILGETTDETDKSLQNNLEKRRRKD